MDDPWEPILWILGGIAVIVLVAISLGAVLLEVKEEEKTKRAHIEACAVLAIEDRIRCLKETP